ncbi:MAG: hypothetical protein ACFE9N_09905 [Promethearchaeota archaeon]
MFQSGNIIDFLLDPAVFPYIIGGIILLVVVIVCLTIHRKLR